MESEHVWSSVRADRRRREAGGADLKTVSTALGHSAIPITTDTYAHDSPAMLHDATKLLDRAIELGRTVARRGAASVQLIFQ